MRATAKAWVGIGVVASLVLAPSLVMAEDDVAGQLRQMNDRLTELEDRLQATNDELDSANTQVQQQQQVIEDAGLAESDSKSGISSFLEAASFTGWVATSYNYNTANSGNNGLKGQNGGLPFHADSNSFALNQLWFEIDKDVNDESRGGFHADILFGKDAEVLGDDLFGNSASGGNDGIELFTAYVSYLAPLGEQGVRIDAGELPTLLGAEVVQSPYNFNITRGNLWAIQPVTNTGVQASTSLDNGVSFTAGFLNDVSTDSNVDSDNNKAVTGQIGYAGDSYSSAVSIIYGSPVFDDAGKFKGNEHDKTGILDILLTANPSEKMSVWLNGDWVFNDNHKAGRKNVPNSDILGVAAGARYQVLEKTGVALRGEYVYFDDTGFGDDGSSDGELWSLTATIDQQITDNLLGRIEGRFDWANAYGGPDNYFSNSNGDITRGDQHVLLAELIYSF